MYGQNYRHVKTKIMPLLNAQGLLVKVGAARPQSRRNLNNFDRRASFALSLIDEFFLLRMYQGHHILEIIASIYYYTLASV